MKPAGRPAEDEDEESAAWRRRLVGEGGERQAAERELHARLIRIALAEVRRPPVALDDGSRNGSPIGSAWTRSGRWWRQAFSRRSGGWSTAS